MCVCVGCVCVGGVGLASVRGATGADIPDYIDACVCVCVSRF
jgi:hypothetical protein